MSNVINIKLPISYRELLLKELGETLDGKLNMMKMCIRDLENEVETIKDIADDFSDEEVSLIMDAAEKEGFRVMRACATATYRLRRAAGCED